MKLLFLLLFLFIGFSLFSDPFIFLLIVSASLLIGMLVWKVFIQRDYEKRLLWRVFLEEKEFTTRALELLRLSSYHDLAKHVQKSRHKYKGFWTAVRSTPIQPRVALAHLVASAKRSVSAPLHWKSMNGQLYIGGKSPMERGAPVELEASWYPSFASFLLFESVNSLPYNELVLDESLFSLIDTRGDIFMFEFVLERLSRDARIIMPENADLGSKLMVEKRGYREKSHKGSKWSGISNVCIFAVVNKS